MTTPPVNPSTVKPIQTTLDALITNAFPSNIVSLSSAAFDGLELGLTVVERMPTPNDPNYTVGIAPVVSSPQTGSTEIHGALGFVGPTITEYLVGYYAFIKDADRERGSAAHSVLAEIVEDMLVADPSFRAALGTLSATILGHTKRMKRHYVRQTRYFANDIGGKSLFLSVAEAIFEVERVL